VSDYSEQGAVPVEDAAVDDPPTVDEVIEQQRIDHPEQAATSTLTSGLTEEEAAAEDAGGDEVGREPDGAPDIEGPNSA
jgi:hypothetical protein